jgi:hypothetical protein
MLSQGKFEDRKFFFASQPDILIVRVVEVEVMFFETGFEIILERVRLYILGITLEDSCKSLEGRGERLLKIAHLFYSLTRSVAFCVTIGVVPGNM